LKRNYDSIVYRSFISALSFALLAYATAAFFAYMYLAEHQPYGPPPYPTGTTSYPTSFAYLAAVPFALVTLVIGFVMMRALYSFASKRNPEVLERMGARDYVARISAYRSEDAIAEQRKIAAALRAKYADKWKFYSPLKRFLLELRIRSEAARIYRHRLYSR
jgi:hypothetical protein